MQQMLQVQKEINIHSQHESGGRFCYVDETDFRLYCKNTR